jgi:catechol 2,3-dioxygenase-like lactoylglutathione lyase family enzyme
VLTRVERVVIGVADLAQAVQTFSQLGFELHVQAAASALAFNADDCLELVAMPEGEVEGLRSIGIESDDLPNDLRAMRSRGIEITDTPPPLGPQDAACAMLGPSNPLPLWFIQHQLPLERRRPHVCVHPNQVDHLERSYVVVPDVAAVVDTYARVLGLAVPPLQRGNVIKASMCIFDVGPVGIGVAQPVEPGPAAMALERRGPGPFQVLYRTRSMRSGAEWMRTHAMPPPARGVRNTGEQAMLVEPDHAHGTYVAFVGPE